MFYEKVNAFSTLDLKDMLLIFLFFILYTLFKDPQSCGALPLKTYTSAKTT